MTVIPLKAEFVEHIHDVLVGTFLPFDEKIIPDEFRDRALIESAVGRPFHTAFGQELLPTLSQKAAALFHSLACNHCFLNGNKRTAVIALDIFLALNEHLLTMSSDQVYELARKTTTSNKEGKKLEDVMCDLSSQIAEASVSIAELHDESLKERIGDEAYEKLMLHVDRFTKFANTVVATMSDHRSA